MWFIQAITAEITATRMAVNVNTVVAKLRVASLVKSREANNVYDLTD